MKIGTRGSPLAMWQAERVRDRLRETSRDDEAGLELEIVEIRTRGEQFPDQPLTSIGQGVFSKELDEALLDGRIDLAVHSLKDLPTVLDPALVLAAVPERESPLDAFISADETGFDDLPAGARIGTGSPRRQAQLLAHRGDIEVVPLRGNVQTRLRKLHEEGLAGTVLAHAGLLRLERTEVITHTFSPEVLLPAVSQGALAIVTRGDDETTRERVGRLESVETRQRIRAERAFLRQLRGGCQAPAGALATIEGGDIENGGIENGELTLDVVLAAPDGSKILRTTRRGPVGDGEALGEDAAREVLSRGGDAILAELERGTS